MVTCPSNPLVKPIHTEAMITMLNLHDIETWLHGPYEEVVRLRKPFDTDQMTMSGSVFQPGARP
jgi:putative SOS response-associated peptidase YedK